MASFELCSSSCDGHIRALSRAVQMASKISKEALLEFTPDKMRLCAKTDLFLVKFVFNRDFFSSYNCDRKQRCYISLKALLMPFKSSILMADRDGTLRSQIKIKCFVEDEVNSQIVFKIGAEPPAATLTYKLVINDLDPEAIANLNAINRTVDYTRVEMSPKPSKKERFLLSAFNNFPGDIDQVTVKTTSSEVRFIGSTSPLINGSNATSEFTHKREDFTTYTVKEDVNITIPLRNLKTFLNLMETSRVQTQPKYIFEGMGLPAHFIYDAHLFRGHFVSATPFEYIPAEIGDDVYPALMGPNESFIAEENVIQADDEYNADDYNLNYVNNDDIEDDEDGYNDNQSQSSEFLDGNLEGLDTTATNYTSYHHTTNHTANTAYGPESIRSEMLTDVIHDPEKVKEILNLDQDPDEIDNIVIQYSSDSDME